MTREHALLVSFATVLFCLPAEPVHSQTTGAIQGTLTDSSGAAVSGATLEARSASLQGFRSATTDSRGGYRFPALPPGTYTVRASLAGFTTVEKTGYVTLDSTATVDLELQVSAEAKVLVTGEAPIIDLSSTTTGSTFTAKVLERMSIGRNYADILLSQPGVNTDTAQNLPGQGDRVVNVALYGSTSLENLFVIDGINTNNVFRGFQGKALNPESMQEVEIKTGGYQAEYGRALGGVVNVITKAGGNEFHGDAFGYFNSREMRADVEVNPDDDIIAAEETRIERWDAGADLGGYILKDRLWFFGSYDRIERDTDRIPQAGPVAGQSFLLESTSDVYSGKLTWNIAQGSTLVGSLLADPEKQSGALSLPASTSPLTFSGIRYMGGKDYSLRLNQLFGSFGILTLQYSRHGDRFVTKIPPEAEIPRVSDRTVPGIAVATGGFGNINRTNNHQSTRDGYSASFAGYVGNHEIKAGGDYEKNETLAIERRTGAQTLTITPCRANPQNPASVDRCVRAGGAGVPYVNWRGEDVNGGVFYSHSFTSNLDGTPVTRIEIETPTLAYSAFVQDTWRISRRLTVNAGLRWDREEIQDFEKRTVIDLDDMWSPRAGVVWDFLGDGTSKAYGSYGRFYYQFPTDLNVRGYGNNEFLFVTAFNYDPESLVDRPGTAFGFQGGTTAPLGPEPTDRNLKGMYQDEYTIGVEKALAPTFVVGLKGNYQRLGEVLEDRCDLDYTHPENRGFPCAILNPGSGEKYARGDFPCNNAKNARPDASELDALCNESGGPPVPRASRIYRGIELTARQSFQERLWVQASYIYSSLRGNYDGAARLVTGQADPGINADFDYFAFDLHNSHGKLYLDRPHSFQLGATYLTPFGLTAGLSTHVRSGPPRNKNEFFNAGYFQEIFSVRRGTAGRAETQYEANISLAYEFKMGPVTIAPRLYVYNILNRQGETRVSDAFNPEGAFDAEGNAIEHSNYGKILERQGPRLFRVAMRVSF